MSPKAKKFSDLAAPVYADPDRRERIETEKRAILTGLRLAELRAEQGLTQVQLARRLVYSLGTTQENVSRIERAEETQLSTIKRYVPRLGP
jgi:lipase chaperone LimK